MGIEPVEPGFPEISETLEPHVEIAKALGSQSVESALRAHLGVDQTGRLENAKVLGYLRLL